MVYECGVFRCKVQNNSKGLCVKNVPSHVLSLWGLVHFRCIKEILPQGL